MRTDGTAKEIRLVIWQLQDLLDGKPLRGEGLVDVEDIAGGAEFHIRCC